MYNPPKAREETPHESPLVQTIAFEAGLLYRRELRHDPDASILLPKHFLVIGKYLAANYRTEEVNDRIPEAVRHTMDFVNGNV